MQLKPISTRLLTLGYVSALLVIAGLSVASHAALDRSLQDNEGSAAIINQTGRQRMLSQRIAGLAAQYRMGDLTAREDLLSAVTEFETSHNSLTARIRANSSNDEDSEQIRSLYFEKSLDAQVRSFVSDARKVADASPNDPTVSVNLSRIFAEARAPLLSGLENVVTFEQRQNERTTKYLKYLEWNVFIILLATLALEAFFIFRPMINSISIYTRELLRLANTDFLTGIPNRRTFMESCETQVSRAERNGGCLSVIVLDIDHFKSINDNYGHAAGDQVLKDVATVIKNNLRRIDVCGRIGGEEFAILLETDVQGAARVAERIRGAVAATDFVLSQIQVKITVSMGATSLHMGAGGLNRALLTADKLMYQAKQTGRNRIVTDSNLEPVRFASADAGLKLEQRI